MEMKAIAIGNTTLKNVKIIQNVNRPEEYDLWIATKDSIVWPTTKCIDVSDGFLLYYGENNGVADYGLINTNSYYGFLCHGKSNGVADRINVINRHLPKCKHCKEIVINNIAGVLTIDKIKEILDEYYPEQYSVERDPKETNEIRYVILKATVSKGQGGLI